MWKKKELMKKQEQLIEDAFSIYNGGKGLDHWSYSSTSSPMAKNLINYSFPQDVRRTFAFRYKANFGNLVNNTVQKLIGHEIWKTSTMKEPKWDREFNKIFQTELGMINEKPPVDNKDKFAREKMVEYAIDCIGVTEKVVKDIVKDDNLICEYHVRKKEMTMIKDILGKVDYLTDKVFIELKTKPPNIRKVKNKEEWTMSSQAFRLNLQQITLHRLRSTICVPRRYLT